MIFGKYTNMNDQLVLKFPNNKIYLKEDYYVSQSNKEAYELINSWPKWIKRTVNIFGPPGSGKTHLSSILKTKTSTIEVAASSINDEVFFEFKTKEALIIDNLDEKVSENLLFSLWNAAIQDNKYLLVNSIDPIIKYKFKLPDLRSRVSSSLMIGLNLPNDELISVILAKNFSDRQIKIEKKHIDFIIKRIDRSYEKISRFISTLDKYSLKKGSPFTLKLIKEVLKMV